MSENAVWVPLFLPSTTLASPTFKSGQYFMCVSSLCVSTRQAVENITSPHMRHSLVTSRWRLNSHWASLSARRRSCPGPSRSLCQLYPVRSRRRTLLIKWKGAGVTSSKCQLNPFINLCCNVFIGRLQCNCGFTSSSKVETELSKGFVDQGINRIGLIKFKGKTNVQRSRF